MRTPTNSSSDLAVVSESLEKQGAGLLARGRLAALQRKVSLFGFHLAPIDLRQSSGEHEAAVSELLERAAVCSNYRDLDEKARTELLVKELSGPRPLRVPHVEYSEFLQKELAILAAAAEGRRRFGARAVPHYVISHCSAVSDLLEVGVLLREVGLLGQVDIIPLFESIADLGNCGKVVGEALDLPLYRGWVNAKRRRAGSHARLFRQQQGRRLLHFELGALQGGGDPGGGVQGARRAPAPVPRPRRHHRPRRRPELRSGAGAAAGKRRRRAAPHRAGRGDRQQVRRPGERPAATSRRWLRRRWRRVSQCRGKTIGATKPSPKRYPPERSTPIARWCTSPGFVDYFRASTPIAEIADLNIGSRPASRRAERAHRGPAGDSVGVQLDPVPPDAARLVWLWQRGGKLARGEKFPRKTARRCTATGRSSAACFPTWTWCSPRATSPSRRATPSWWRTRSFASRSSAASRTNGSARASGSRRSPATQELLADNPTLARSIRARFPYLDPLNHVQVELLRRYRSGDRDPRLLRGIHLTINGLAAGLRNSG